MNTISRKDFFKQVGAIGTAAAGLAVFVSACGGGGDSTPATAPDPCNDLSNLTETDLVMRRNVNYITQTEIPEQRCDNCQLFKQPEAGSSCGGCLLFKGPVTNAGWCSSWIEKPSV